MSNNPQRDNAQNKPINCPDRDTQDLLRDAQRQGFEVAKSNSGHYLVRKDGRLVATVSGTSMSKGARDKMRRELQKAGLR